MNLTSHERLLPLVLGAPPPSDLPVQVGKRGPQPLWFPSLFKQNEPEKYGNDMANDFLTLSIKETVWGNKHKPSVLMTALGSPSA